MRIETEEMRKEMRIETEERGVEESRGARVSEIKRELI